MKVVEEKREHNSNGNHENPPLGLQFIFDGCRFSIKEMDDVNNMIICVSKTQGVTYFGFKELEDYLDEGKAAFVIDRE
ncbi:hypothetical protein [Bacillus sp. Au-Bac7]|uniref:hypothetical protein n=1 Tax=Bacillus sp. Au-Bac7 TaxID=2906458 RepID=UPI001E2B197D|nr:hypothetical protein [Bacillus sp. Au-Bac7]MCE4048766.1 hypothetical protein [Bacillus sp. Au-Bac7]